MCSIKIKKKKFGCINWVITFDWAWWTFKPFFSSSCMLWINLQNKTLSGEYIETQRYKHCTTNIPIYKITQHQKVFSLKQGMIRCLGMYLIPFVLIIVP